MAPSLYREHLPSLALRPYIECYWSRVWDRAGERAPHRVLPDGCLDIVFNFGDPVLTQRAGAQWLNRERSSVVGAMTQPLRVESGGRADFLGVRFRPGRARSFLRLPVSELTDGSTPLENFWGPPSKNLAERLGEVSRWPGRISLLENELARRLAAAPPPDGAVEAAVARILAARGDVSIETLCAERGVSRQHLARRFACSVGLSPKVFCRIVRFQSLLERLRRGRHEWAATALEAGYYDQSHLIADFQEFAGVTPARFAAGG